MGFLKVELVEFSVDFLKEFLGKKSQEAFFYEFVVKFLGKFPVELVVGRSLSGSSGQIRCNF